MTRNKKRKKKKGKSVAIAVFLIVAIVAIAAGSLFYLNLCNKPLDSANKEYVSIEIPSGTATIAIGRILQENGLIASAERFKLYAKIKGYDGASFLVGASAGQTLKVEMSSPNGAAYFNVTAPGANEAREASA